MGILSKKLEEHFNRVLLDMSESTKIAEKENNVLKSKCNTTASRVERPQKSTATHTLSAPTKDYCAETM